MVIYWIFCGHFHPTTVFAIFYRKEKLLSHITTLLLCTGGQIGNLHLSNRVKVTFPFLSCLYTLRLTPVIFWEYTGLDY